MGAQNHGLSRVKSPFRDSTQCGNALAAALPALKRFYRIVGTALGHGVALAELRSDRPVALILGNEENGIAPATLALCDTVVTIPGVALPGSGQVQSLNVAAATAVLFYALRSP